MRQPTAQVAEGRSLRDFQPLLPGEQRLMGACRLGERAKLGATVPEAPNNEALRVRAAFLRFLLLGGDGQAPMHEHGVQLFGAYVEGVLDLDGCRILHNVEFQHCKFTDHLLAQDVRVEGSMTLEGSHLCKGINADRLQCDGGLHLRNGFMATGAVQLSGAQIGGNLLCSRGLFKATEGNALSADGAIVKGSVLFDDDFKATGEVRLLGAQIGGDLSCRGGQFDAKENKALSADGAIVKGSVLFDDGFKADGEVRLVGAQIGGDLSCCGGQFYAKESKALSADSVVVKGSVFLVDGFKATGEVRLKGAQIGSDLLCYGGKFEVKKGNALSADRAVVKDSVFFNDGFKATGEVRLLGAQIGGNLECGGGQFEGKESNALSADGAVVKGNVFFNNGFKATGNVRLLGTQIGGSLSCGKGQFEVKESNALSADRVVVKGNVLFNDGFKATGKVRLVGAQIGGNLSCRRGQFQANNEGNAVLSVERATVQGGWFFDQLEQPVFVNAEHMQVSVLVDVLESWAPGSTIDGLRYGSLGGNAPTRAKTRLQWLGKQPPRHRGEADRGKHFCPQPWRQLQSVLREMGHAEDAREIGIAFEQQLRKIGRIGRSPPGTKTPMAWSKRAIANTVHVLFGLLSGYGYRPMRLMAWMALVWLICALCYWRLALPPYDAIGPSDPLVFQNERYASCVPGSPAAAAATASGAQRAGNWYLCESLPAAYSTFSPLAYSLDIILPLVDLGQEKAWGSLVATPRASGWEELGTRSPGHLVRWLVWFETLFGWVASLLLVAIVSGLARRSED